MKRSFAQLQAKGAQQVRGSSLSIAQGMPVSLPTRFPAVGAPSADWRLKSLYLFEAPQRSIEAWNRHDADEPIPDDVEFSDGVRVLNDRHKERKCHLPASIRVALGAS
jgi:hypothetical protein